jgi:NhaP-type Na+/H+ or K+/H+ antiporter
MCCSDTVAAVSIIKFDEQPMLFSIVFGEGIVNDAVSIILFNAVFTRTNSSLPLSWFSPLEIGWEFCSLTFYSLLVGIIGALVLAILLKNFRFLAKSPVHEVIMVFVTGYLVYMVSETMKYSAIVSLLACGICLSHYAWYNLSNQSKVNSSVSSEAIGFAAEAFVFVYIGLTAFSYNDKEWSLMFCVGEIIVAALCRFIAVMGTLYGFKFFFKHKVQLNFQEVIFTCFAGMIRGAIAFGLVLKLDQSLPNRDVLITSMLMVVIVTTCLYGTVVPILSARLTAAKRALMASQGIEMMTHGHGHGHG